MTLTTFVEVVFIMSRYPDELFRSIYAFGTPGIKKQIKKEKKKQKKWLKVVIIGLS